MENEKRTKKLFELAECFKDPQVANAFLKLKENLDKEFSHNGRLTEFDLLSLTSYDFNSYELEKLILLEPIKFEEFIPYLDYLKPSDFTTEILKSYSFLEFNYSDLDFKKVGLEEINLSDIRKNIDRIFEITNIEYKEIYSDIDKFLDLLLSLSNSEDTKFVYDSNHYNLIIESKQIALYLRNLLGIKYINVNENSLIMIDFNSDLFDFYGYYAGKLSLLNHYLEETYLDRLLNFKDNLEKSDKKGIIKILLDTYIKYHIHLNKPVIN